MSSYPGYWEMKNERDAEVAKRKEKDAASMATIYQPADETSWPRVARCAAHQQFTIERKRIGRLRGVRAAPLPELPEKSTEDRRKERQARRRTGRAIARMMAKAGKCADAERRRAR